MRGARDALLHVDQINILLIDDIAMQLSPEALDFSLSSSQHFLEASWEVGDHLLEPLEGTNDWVSSWLAMIVGDLDPIKVGCSGRIPDGSNNMPMSIARLALKGL